MKKEDLGADPQSLDNRRLSVIARNPNHPMHTHAKAELERRRMKTNEGAMKRIATTQASKTDRMASTDKKGLETFKKKPATEAYKEPQGQAKRIMSPLQKARMDKEKADRDADGKLKEKTLTPAELKKREKIAKAIERDNPDMPMDKKMAIATATAKRVAESKDDDYHKTLGQTKNSDEGIAALKKKHGMSHTKAVATLKRLMGEQKVNELKKSTLASYIKKASDDRAKNAYDIGKSGKINYKGLKRRQGINRAVNKMANEEATIKELDKKTLGSYIKKAGPDREKQKAQAARHSDAGDMADKDRDMYKHYGKAQRAMDKAANRSKYIGKAVDKLTKEATIPDGQTAMTRVAKVSDADKEKLIKIRKMLDKEKKK